MNKPDYISKPDWELVLKKYNNDITFIQSKLDENYPIQYLIGDVEFYNCLIKVNENVLIPRYETELLIEKTMSYFKDQNKTIKILDIGTGSGCIAIALAKNLNAQVDALDISDEALTVAQENAKINKVKIDFFKQDILKEPILKKYDLIISNPPYIKYGDEVDPKTKYEPQNALFADNDGLIFYEEIIKKSVGHLTVNGIIAFEIGINQANSIKNIVLKYYPNSEVIIAQDYTNRDRMIFIKNKE